MMTKKASNSRCGIFVFREVTKKMVEGKIEKSLEEIKNLLRKNEDVPFNFVQAAQYLSISHSQLYKYTSQRKIPFHKPSGKYLYFFKQELDAWIRKNDELEDRETEDGRPETGEMKADNQLGMFDEEICTEDKIEPP